MAEQLTTDLLSSLLARISLRGHVYARPTGCGEWQINPTGHARATYHLITSGTCWLHLRKGQPPIELRTGDLVFFPNDAWHVMSASPELSGESTRLPAPDGGEQTQLVCGLYRADDRELERLLQGLPPLVHIRADDADGRLREVIAFLGTEAEQAHPGSSLILDSLSDVLLALVLRHCLEQGLISHGLLAALGDPRLAAVLAAVHADPGAHWDVSTLAKRAALSRSTLADRFQKVLGASPGHYLAQLRMQEATVQLRNEDASVAQIAERLGYATEAAFRRAFKRTTGLTPGEVRRQRTATETQG
ncbi:MAG: hypothetical protein A3E01_14850 [Gammaproteobacteria bacterium RIFCSPHIGHO2_12_FULL_63_22]|nr:MAG: hypothetical protein A3E01_14850 [Gammaproteobacteria bacterium RIFCSPHIGHO2_12_FULL_63_22]